MQVALLSMLATAVGLDFSCATVVVFAEVPDTADVLLQAEGRAHRLTSKSAVNVYVLLCKASRDVRTWCRLAESLERQAPLLDTGRKSHGAAGAAGTIDDPSPEDGEQGATHACGSKAVGMGVECARSGVNTGCLLGDVAAEVRAARLTAVADASGCARRLGGEAGGKKALHVDGVIDLSVALQQQRAAAFAPESAVSGVQVCDGETADVDCSSDIREEVEGRGEGGASAGNTVVVATGHTESDVQCSSEVATVDAAVGNGGDEEVTVVCDTSDDDASLVAATCSAQEPESDCKGATDGKLALSVDVPPCGSSQAVVEPPCALPQAAVAALSQPGVCKRSEQGEISGADTQPTEAEQPQSGSPVHGTMFTASQSAAVLDVAGSDPVCESTDPACRAESLDARIVAQDGMAELGVVAEATLAADCTVAVATADDEAYIVKPSVVLSSDKQREPQPVVVGSSSQEPLADSEAVAVPHERDQGVNHQNDDRSTHAEHSSMQDDLLDWLAAPSPAQSDYKHGNDDDDAKDFDMEDICVQQEKELKTPCNQPEVQQKVPPGRKEGTAPENVSGFDASIVFFMVNQHTENVTLLLGEDGHVPLGLRLPLSALQPKAAGAIEEHVDHLQTLLKVRSLCLYLLPTEQLTCVALCQHVWERTSDIVGAGSFFSETVNLTFLEPFEQVPCGHLSTESEHSYRK